MVKRRDTHQGLVIGKKDKRRLKVLERLYDKLKSANMRLHSFLQEYPTQPNENKDFDLFCYYERELWSIQRDREWIKRDIVSLSRQWSEDVPHNIDCHGLSFWSTEYVI